MRVTLKNLKRLKLKCTEKRFKKEINNQRSTRISTLKKIKKRRERNNKNDWKNNLMPLKQLRRNVKKKMIKIFVGIQMAKIQSILKMTKCINKCLVQKKDKNKKMNHQITREELSLIFI